MAYIYAYPPDEVDCSDIGMVGALLDQDAVYDLQAGEFGELTFTHPIDQWGKWKCLQDGVILKTMIPVRLVPEVDDGAYIHTVDVYKVSSAATRYQCYIYYASTAEKDPTYEIEVETGEYYKTSSRDHKKGDPKKKKVQKTKHKKLLKRGTRVYVIADPHPGDDKYRYKVRVGSGKKKVVGWMEKAALRLIQKNVNVDETPDGLEALSASYAIQQQLFRVYSIETNADTKDIGSITVRARRLVYDLLGNVCNYKATKVHTCQGAARGILNSTTHSHPFTVYSDIGDKHVGLDVRGMNALAALIDPDEGVVAHWGGEVVCDDYDIYILHHAGKDRGVTIRYGGNLVGVTCTADSSNVATGIRPVGETAAGNPLILDGHLVNGEYRYNYDRDSNRYLDKLKTGYRFAIDDTGTQTRIVPSVIERDIEDDGYAIPKVAVIDVADAKVTKVTKDTDPAETSVLTTVMARRMMVQEAYDAFDSGCDQPDIEIDVDFTLLGDTLEYAQYRHLETLFVYDTVHVTHPKVQVEAELQLMSISWKIREERVQGATFGSLGSAVASIPGWQISGISGSKIAVGSISGQQLGDGAISEGHIQVNSINAQTIQSDAVLARHIKAGEITAEHIATGSITADRLDAEAVNTKLLVALNAVIQQIQTGHAEVDDLEAGFATIQVLEAKYATFDREAVTNLVASALNLRFGSLTDVFIDNLRVAYAQMVSATIGNLCIKASDGHYYNIDVSQAGLVTASPVDVTQEEIDDGETEAGRTILDTDIVAANLSTSTLLGTFALVNAIDASRIDVDRLTARQAFIDQLAAREIIGERTIRMIAGQARQAGDIGRVERVFRAEPEPPYDAGDLWIQGAGELLVCATAKADGESFDADDWQPQTAYDAALATMRDEVSAMVEVDTDGLHIKGAQLEDGELVETLNEVVVTPEAMNVVVNQETYSRFAANYAQFGNYQMRRTSDGGLAFIMV